MLALGIYILIGLLACGAVAWKRDKSANRGELPLAMLFDPVWPVVLLWPLWLVVVLVERSFPKEGSVPSSPGADPIGQVGVVVSSLRPLGRIQIGSSHFDARSDGRIIEVGAAVRVVARSMSEFVVEEEPNQSPEPTPGLRPGAAHL